MLQEKGTRAETVLGLTGGGGCGARVAESVARGGGLLENRPPKTDAGSRGGACESGGGVR